MTLCRWPIRTLVLQRVRNSAGNFSFISFYWKSEFSLLPVQQTEGLTLLSVKYLLLLSSPGFSFPPSGPAQVVLLQFVLDWVLRMKLKWIRDQVCVWAAGTSWAVSQTQLDQVGSSWAHSVFHSSTFLCVTSFRHSGTDRFWSGYSVQVLHLFLVSWTGARKKQRAAGHLMTSRGPPGLNRVHKESEKINDKIWAGKMSSLILLAGHHRGSEPCWLTALVTNTALDRSSTGLITYPFNFNL